MRLSETQYRERKACKEKRSETTVSSRTIKLSNNQQNFQIQQEYTAWTTIQHFPRKTSHNKEKTHYSLPNQKQATAEEKKGDRKTETQSKK